MNPLTNPGNLPYLESLYAAYQKDPASVGGEWHAYFAELARDSLSPTNGNAAVADQPSPARIDRAGDGRGATRSFESTLHEQLNDMIRAYRTLGHRAARLDPLGEHEHTEPTLDPGFYGLTAERFEQLLAAAGLHWPGPLTLREIVLRLRETYCGSIGVELMHIEDRSVREWLQQRIESNQNRLELNQEERVRTLTQLIHAAIFEQFTRNQFVGAKSFSLEGAESLVPLLLFAIEKAGRGGVREIVLAMAHRGRLNVLVNVIGKKARQIYREFLDPSKPDGGGDVKYHLGYSSDYQTLAGPKVHLSLCFNPSHLEFVNPVAAGRVRAKQDRSGDTERERGMALLIHGEAAFAGEGVIQETLNLSQLDAYAIGGVLHVIINNQIGFTTCPSEGRSSRYASDVAKMLQIPIFHVNGDDPEAVQQTVSLAMDFRRRYRRDVVIDLVCYRRHGHNEGDEPTFTQPRMYRLIRRHPPVTEMYLKQLIAQRLITRERADRIAKEFRDLLEQELSLAQTDTAADQTQSYGGIWSGYSGGLEPKDEIPTAVAQERLSQMLDAQTRLPADFHPHPKIARAAALRRKMAAGAQPLDWAAAESLALASLAIDGVRVRLAGQDTARGTFSQRHAVLHDFENGRQYMPLNHLTDDQAPVEVYNSPLSEAGALGFEYGYSLDYPDALVLWEAQFGDFVNAAQVIIDQFISSAEEKWRRVSGLVLLLPHGFEGMGPEHSSARIERFLQLGARDNLQVVYPTTPAQYFHCLRRQALRRWRKPLVIMTPKSLLRHRDATSSLEELSQGRFETVIGESRAAESIVKKILLCSGKIYYELKSYQAERQRHDVAIVRIEQLYPTPRDALAAALSRYPNGTPVVWVQEEPTNMGASCFWSLQFGTRLLDRFPLTFVARPASASPATGSASRHQQQQAELVAAAFAEVN